MAGIRAQPAAVAFFLVNFDNLANQNRASLIFVPIIA
jgi:hypothetical protein